ncbi:MAG: DUF692 family protein [Bryobacteraceae bacterium]
MHRETQEARPAGRVPALATTYEGRNPKLLDRILPIVGFIEVTPDSLAEMDGDAPSMPEDKIRELQAVASEARVIVHGVGLSIGSHDGVSNTYLRLLDQLLARVPARWHSEHLGYVTVDGNHLGTMLAIPKTERVLDMICERVRIIQDRYPLPFLMENVAHVLPDYPGDYSEAGFLNELTRRTGCGLILDVYNLECDAHNHAFPIQEFLAELDMRPVRELHLAGGVIHQGFKLDVHSRITAASTVALARQVLGMAPNVEAITYELLAEAIEKLGPEIIGKELERLSAALLN